MSDIHFFNENIEFSLENKAQVISWISAIVAKEGYQINTLNYIFCSDDYLLVINKEYLNHDTYTDIITFDNSTVDHEIESDIYISIERIRENAETFNVPFEDELHRVLIHGVLHLIGWEDSSPEQKKSMREKEDACLSLLHN